MTPFALLRRRTHLVRVVIVLVVAVLLAGGLSRPAGATEVNPPVITVPAAKATAVFFVPHADDDVLSMGVYMTELVRLGVDVHVVYYTDGAATGVCGPRYVTVPVSADHPQGSEEECLSNWSGLPADQNWFGQPVSAFVADRDTEFRDSVEALGVAKENIDIYAPGGARRRDGTVDVAYAQTMLQHYRETYPKATFVTMSWLDAHQDHASAGLALRHLVETDPTDFPPDDAIFTLARWYWPYAYPDRATSLAQEANSMRAAQGYPLADGLARCLDTTCQDAMQQALLAYQQPYDIGYRSVPDYLDVASQDPAVLLHGVAVGRYKSTVTVSKASRTTTGSTTLTVSGRLAVVPSPDATYPVSQNNADGLARGFNPAVTLHPATAVTVHALSASGAVLGTASAPVHNNSWTGSVSVPAGSTSVTASVAQTTGTDTAVGSVVTQTQQEVVASAPGVSLRGGTLTAGYGQPLTMTIAVRRSGRGITGSSVRLVLPLRASSKPASTATGAAPHGVTAAAGTLTVHPVLTAPGTSTVTASAPGPVLAAAAAADRLRTVVRPAALSVVATSQTVTSGGAKLHVIGAVRGRDYPIARGLLRPATITAWITLHGRRSVLSTFHTASGGAFRVSLPVRGSGRVHFDVAALSGTYAKRASAGVATMHRL